MTNGRRIFVELMLALELLAPLAVAQKPPAPTPPPAPSPTPGPSPTPNPSPGPPPTAPGIPSTNPLSNAQPIQPISEYVMYLIGRVATSDSTALPNNVLVERVCNNIVRQQVYATLRGDFSMDLSSRMNTAIDVTAQPGPQYGAANYPVQGGIPREELAKCELRASVSGFLSDTVSLVDLDVYSGTVNLGTIVVERTAKIKGATVSAVPYNVPKDARNAYEKGLSAEKHNKLADARKQFGRAVEIYPKYASAWFQLGAVLEKQRQKDDAHAAYTRATTIDTKFLPPYMALATMAFKAEDWPNVLLFTDHIIELDPWSRRDFKGYMVDMDTLNYPEAYFYNALANYQLNQIDAAEKSAIKAEHLDMGTHYPELHLVTAEISALKKNYTTAIAEMQEYLQLVPNTDQLKELRQQLAEWERLSGTASNRPSPERN